MGNVRRVVLFLCSLWLLSFGAAAAALAEPAIDETRKLLEKSLSVKEIDREIARLEAEEGKLTAALAETHRQIELRGQAMEQQRVQAGQLLRAYYMGERDGLWLLLLTSTSFSEALAVFDYVAAVLERDHRLLESYRSAYAQLQAAREQQQSVLRSIVEVKEGFRREKLRVEQLEGEIQTALARLSNEEREKQLEQMRLLSDSWERKGKPLFDLYFRSLSELSLKFPELLARDKNSLKFEGLKMSVQLQDTLLNDFLQEQDIRFKGFRFAFQDGAMTISGSTDGTQAVVKGKYRLDQDTIKFRIEQLQYNGFELPDTTARDLERQYDLTLDPRRFISSIVPTAVSIANGKLVIELRLK